MGYAHYDLPDGREAGYAVEATCDQPGCTKYIHRGYDYLCGDIPDGHRGPDEPGCGRYYCGKHLDYANHTCPNPECAEWDPEENETCQLVRGHEGPHQSESETWEATSMSEQMYTREDMARAWGEGYRARGADAIYTGLTGCPRDTPNPYEQEEA